MKTMVRGVLVALILLSATFAGAAQITVGGGLSDWGLANAAGAYTPYAATSVGAGAAGYNAATGVTYFEEQGASNPWGYVEPGYGGYKFDIAGLYYTLAPGQAYIAAVLGTPPGGTTGMWNSTTWGSKEYLGDIAISLNGGQSYQYALETTGANAGKVYTGGNWTAPTAFPQSKPVNMTGGTDTGWSTQFKYELFGANTAPDGTPLYYIEAAIAFPTEFAFDPSGLALHLTQTCGNDVANVAPVPEPGTLVLLGSGLVGLAGYGRKRFARS